MRHPPYIHPDQPIPRPCQVLWKVLDDLQYPYLKIVWIGNKRVQWRRAYFVPAVVSFRPGIEHRVAIDFNTAAGTFGSGNRKRSILCAGLGLEYFTVKRSDSYAEMMVALRAIIEQLRSITEYTPDGR